MMLDTSAPVTASIEQALIAAGLSDNTVIDAHADMVRADDFENPAYGEIWQAMCDLRRDGRAVNVVTLRGLGADDPLGGQSPLEALRRFEFAGNAPDAAEFADRIREASLARQIKAHAETLAEQAESGNTPPTALLTAYMPEFDALLTRANGRRKTSFTFAEAADEALEALQADGSDDLIPTGLRDIDNAIGGLGRGRLIVVAGRSSMGKSAVASNIATNIAQAGYDTLIFSLEMSAREWLYRIASARTWAQCQPVPYSKAHRRDLTGEEHEALARELIEAQQMPAIIDDAGGLSMSDIAARTRRAASQFREQGKRLGAIIVDHIGKMSVSNAYGSRRDLAVGELTAGLAELAKSENIAVLALHQLNLQPEGRENRRPNLADLRDSGRVEEDADVVMLAYREAYYLEREKHPAESAEEQMRLDRLEETQNLIELSIPKNRQGQTGTVDLFCDMSCNAIRDLERSRA
jgi:replicative DNA helicase